MFRTAVRLGLVCVVWAIVGQVPLAQQRPVFRSDAQLVIVDAYPLATAKSLKGCPPESWVAMASPWRCW